MFTEGKVSGCTMYLLFKVYKLKVLALAWNNFFKDEYKQNIENLVERIEVDHKFVEIGDKCLI